MWIWAIGVFGVFLSVPSHAQVPQRISHANMDNAYVVIHCSLKLLQLWRNTKLIKEYPVEIGKGGLRKTRRGDHRTPIGNYEITWMASRVSEKGRRIEPAESWCRGNKFVKGITGPPLEKLWSRAYGGRQATVMSISYPNAKNRARGDTGECIHIHATRRLVDGDLSKSHGCIHMFPQDAMKLYEMVRPGTPVKILP